MQVTKSSRWLSSAILTGILAAQASAAAAAEDCAGTGCPKPPPTAPLFHVEKLGDSGVKLTSNNGGDYTVTLSGADSTAGSNVQAASGEAWRKSVDADVKAELGYFFNFDLRADLTNVKRDADDQLFALQPLDSMGDNRRAMERMDLKAGFLGDRLMFSSSRLASSLTPLAIHSFESRGDAELDRLSAWLWRSGTDGLSIEGAASRIDASYQDLTKTNTTDPLQTKNRSTRQLRSNLKLGWAGLFVSGRDWSSLAPDPHGDRQNGSEVEAGASVAVPDLLGTSNSGGFFSTVLPNTIWLSESRGAIEHSLASASPGETEKSAIGMTRYWRGGALNVSYWQSSIDTALPQAAQSEWRGHGVDLGGNVSPGRWSVSGNLSWYTADNFGLQNNSVENSLNGSLFVSWRAPSWPKVSAGVTNYGYEAEYFDYHGLERNGALRYQLMLDCSSLITNALSDKSAKLTFLASFDANNSRSQWSQSGYSSAAGNTFFGFRFAHPIIP